MKPVPAKSESRRLEVRRQRSERRQNVVERVLRWASPGSLLIWSLFCVGVTVILLSGSQSMIWRLGQRVDQDITARVPFEMVDGPRTERDRRAARDATPNAYTLNAKLFDAIRREFEGFLELAESAQDEAKFAQQVSERRWTRSLPSGSLREFTGQEQKRQAYRAIVAGVLQGLGRLNIIEQPSDLVLRDTTKLTTAILRQPGQPDRRVPTSRLIDVSRKPEVVKAVGEAVSPFPQPLRAWAAEVVIGNMYGTETSDGRAPAQLPVWNLDQDATGRAMAAAELAVPPVKVSMKARDTLVPAGTVLSDTQLVVLKQEHESYLRAQKTDPVLRRQNVLRQLGILGAVLLVSLGLGTYAVHYQDRILNRSTRSLGLAGLILLMVLLSRLNEIPQYPWDLPLEFTAAFVCIAAALLTIAYNQRFSLGVCGSLAVLATLASRADLGLFLMLVSASSVMVFSLRDIRTRSRLVFAGMLSAIAAFVASSSMGLIAGQEVQYVLVHAIAAAGASLAAGFIVQGILPNFERAFGVATSMTLLEWSDVSKPLLRMLSQEAPGTYSHSMILGQMAEEAAEAIGARGLLARVGAMYHDIGKVQKAEYFVENQESRMNRHDRLSPTMSLLIIVGHVKDGVEMARAYGVPRILHQFIAEHHGTTVVRYFHHAASEAARAKGRSEREVPESEFRYPGPKPRSRETAILMICDGCESAVRALAEPIPGRIESTVHQVIMDRLNDGQFDECDITLRQLKVVEQSLVKSLGAIHHGRIKYPKAASRDSGPQEGTAVEREQPPQGQAPPRPAEIVRPA